MAPARIDHPGSPPAPSRLDGGTWDVDNNVWIVGDDTEAIVIDAAHDATPSRRRSAAGAAARSRAPTHTTTTSTRPPRWPRDRGADPAPPGRPPRCGSRPTRTERSPDGELADGLAFPVGGPASSPCCTPRATRRARCACTPPTWAPSSPATPSSRAGRARRAGPSRTPTIIESIRGRLLDLPDETVVRTGHGPDTTIGAEREGLSAEARGCPALLEPGGPAAGRATVAG